MRARLEALRVYVTPTQLRIIADRLEKQWQEADVCDPLPAETVSDCGTAISFVIDHEAMYDEYGVGMGQK